ncbi:hypothetical protein S40293_01883 [Stachybotrys chartarum IBT 40293]|nr:hypothetical protein S40293_01883 [Stachybotrys chartarum IBT 40293]
MASQDTAQSSRPEAREKAFADVKQLTAPHGPNDASSNEAYEIRRFRPFPSSDPSSMFSSRDAAPGQGPIGDFAISHDVLMPSKSPRSVEIGHISQRFQPDCSPAFTKPAPIVNIDEGSLPQFFPGLIKKTIRSAPSESEITWSVSDIQENHGESPGVVDSGSGLSHCWHLTKGYNFHSPYTEDGSTERRSTDSPYTASQNSHVAQWVMRLPKASVVRLHTGEDDDMDPEFHKCDIDVVTGQLIPGTAYPDTFLDRPVGPCQSFDDIGWRQLNMTSMLRITREINIRQRIAEDYRRRIEEKQRLKDPLSEEDPWPKAKCLIRPAEPTDCEAIAAIINLENRAGRCPQILEEATVAAYEVLKTLEHCAKNCRPFIVAEYTTGNLVSRSKWSKDDEDEYQEFIKFRQSQPKIPAIVVGFALITETQGGLLQGPSAGLRYSGQVKLVVHPEHRQKLFGTALLDRILLSVAPYHRSLVDHKWECTSEGCIYEDPVQRNTRQYAKLYIQVNSRGKVDEDLAWRGKMLEKFDFRQVAYLSKTLRSEKKYGSEWLDLSLWQLETYIDEGQLDRCR